MVAPQKPRAARPARHAAFQRIDERLAHAAAVGKGQIVVRCKIDSRRCTQTTVYRSLLELIEQSCKAFQRVQSRVLKGFVQALSGCDRAAHHTEELRGTDVQGPPSIDLWAARAEHRPER